jgi:hypothetical protein
MMVAAASAAPGRARTRVCPVDMPSCRRLDGKREQERNRDWTPHGDKAIAGLRMEAPVLPSGTIMIEQCLIGGM